MVTPTNPAPAPGPAAAGPGAARRLDSALLAGRTVLVAGGTGAIGTALVDTLARHGADLVLHSHDRSPAAAALAAELTHRYGTRVTAGYGDVTEPDQMGRLRDQLQAAGIGRLHALVNCTTGFDGRPVDVTELSVKEFRRVVDVDLVGSFVLVKELLPLLAGAREPGVRSTVVLFSSLAAVHGRPGAAHLCAAKAGVQGLALGLARDLAPHGVQLHVVAPGPVGPHRAPTGVPASTVQEVADVLTFLASPLGDPLSGQTLTLRGTAAVPPAVPPAGPPTGPPAGPPAGTVPGPAGR